MNEARARNAAWLDVLIATALGAGYVALLIASARTLGYARDEGFYFDAARSYEAWFRLLASDPKTALQPHTVDRYWSANHEHPALMKSLFALSHAYTFEKWRWFSEPGTAYRFPAMLVSGMAVAVTYVWGRRAIGRLAGLVAALLFAFMPRIFYHSHLACFDMPVAAMWLLTSYVYWRSLTTGGVLWAVATGISYGLLLDTKHNAWLLPGALVLHFVITRGVRALRELRAGRLSLPSAWLAMILISPALFYLGWPWIWHNTGARLSEYIAFHTGHEYYNMEFLGRTYWKPPMPRLYAWLMTVATVPSTTLLLGGIGVVHSLRAARSDRQRWHTDALWLVCIALSYAPWLSSATPIFGGTKHWITAYPFLCLFAGRGFALAVERISALLPERRALRVAGASAITAAVLAAPVAITLHSHPWGLSSYVPVVGGAQGAATLGLNRTFWGYTTGSVTDYLNQHVPPNGRVYVHDTAYPSWEMLKSDGRLRADIQGVGSIDGSSFALYHHEPHMQKVEQQIWVAYGTTTPAHIGAHDGVPVIWVYARP